MGGLLGIGAGLLAGAATTTAVTTLIPALGVTGAVVLGGMAAGATSSAINHGNVLFGALTGGLSAGLMNWGFGSSISNAVGSRTLFGLSSNALSAGLTAGIGGTVGANVASMFGNRTPSYPSSPLFKMDGELEQARSYYQATEEKLLQQYEEKIKEWEKAQDDLKHVLSEEEEKRLKKDELERELKEKNKHSMGVAAERREKERQIRLRDQIENQGSEVFA